MVGVFGWINNFNKGEDKMKKENRKDILLKAAYDLLKKCDESTYVLSVLEETIKYDGTNCDGSCLMEDIAIELGIDND